MAFQETLATYFPKSLQNIFKHQSNSSTLVQDKKTFVRRSNAAKEYIDCYDWDRHNWDPSYQWEKAAFIYIFHHPEKMSLPYLAHACEMREPADYSRPLIMVTHDARLLTVKPTVITPYIEKQQLAVENRVCLRCAVENIDNAPVTAFDLYRAARRGEDPARLKSEVPQCQTVNSCLRGKFAVHFVHAKLAMEWAKNFDDDGMPIGASMRKKTF